MTHADRADMLPPMTAPETPSEETPRPGAGTPAGDALARAERAFELGDYAEVRRLCAPLVGAEAADVAAAARALVRRTSVDPVQVAVLVASFGLFLWIVFRYVL